MSKLTADTITDEQIVELLSEAADRGDRVAFKRASQALGLWCESHVESCESDRESARARCAEILNARADGK